MNNKEIQYIAEKLNKKWVKGFKQLGNNPKALTKHNYINDVLPNINKYYITDKAEGERCFLLISQTSSYYITSTNKVNINSDVSKIFKGECIFDCELINKIPYIFDVILYNSENVSVKPFYERLRVLNEVSNLGSRDQKLNVKKYYKLEFNTYQKTIMDVYRYKTKQSYEVDGLIFTEMTQNYNKTSNLKWKPPNKLTIDFLVLSDTIKKQTKSQKQSYILANGINSSTANIFGITPNQEFSDLVKQYSNNDYIPVPFYNSLIPNIFYYESDNTDLNGHIVELSLDTKNNKWIFYRIREDREIELKNGTYYGNNYKVAEMTLQSILNPLSLKELTSSIHILKYNMYFKKQDDSYKIIKKFNNYAKNMLIRKQKNVNNVIDLASGRGGDLEKYIDAGVKNLLMLEIDIDAIDELLERKYRILPNSQNSCNLTILRMDLNKNYKDNIAIIDNNFTNVDKYLNNIPNYKAESVQSIHCHFAMHYLLKDKKSAENIASFISHYLEKGGRFTMTLFNGRRVFDLLKKYNGKWSPNKKYMIEYKGRMPSKFSGFGHNINVLLPLTDKPYEEPLVDLLNIENIFKKYKLELFEMRNFTYIMEYYTDGEDIIGDDAIFGSLYDYVIFEKK